MSNYVKMFSTLAIQYAYMEFALIHQGLEVPKILKDGPDRKITDKGQLREISDFYILLADKHVINACSAIFLREAVSQLLEHEEPFLKDLCVGNIMAIQQDVFNAHINVAPIVAQNPMIAASFGQIYGRNLLRKLESPTT